MNKKILLFSRDPGGCNVIAPLFSVLKSRLYNVNLYGKDISLINYKRYHIEGRNIMESIKEVNLDEIEKFLILESPDFIITGTSADDYTEKYLWKAAEKLNIPTFAILDQWINYGLRFSEFSTDNIIKYNNCKRHLYMPTKILVMDNYAKIKLQQEGIDNSRILVSGSPYFDYLVQHKNEHSNDYITSFRKDVLKCASDEIVITYASEPIVKTYKENDSKSFYWGYTEKTIFVNLCEALNDFVKIHNKTIKLVVRLHPKEEATSYNNIATRLDKRIILILDNRVESLVLISASDLICGMSSMFLIESAILQKNIISIQIGLLKENPFVLHNMKVITSIFSKKDLSIKLEELLIRKEKPNYNWILNESSIDNVINFMEEILCQF